MKTLFNWLKNNAGATLVWIFLISLFCIDSWFLFSIGDFLDVLIAIIVLVAILIVIAGADSSTASIVLKLLLSVLFLIILISYFKEASTEQYKQATTFEKHILKEHIASNGYMSILDFELMNKKNEDYLKEKERQRIQNADTNATIHARQKLQEKVGIHNE